MPIVTLLTDFGLADGYVAQMKGVILNHCHDCQIVDLSHLVGRHNIVEGAFLLGSTVPYFPRDSIHVAVVDPGVGTSRLPIVIECKLATLVGPDNGVLTLAADQLGAEHVYRIDESMLKVGDVSSTFHGRDIFAVAAGKLAKGKSPRSFGKSLRKIVALNLPKPEVGKSNVRGTVLHVDAFGNIITNLANDLTLPFTSLRQTLRIKANGKTRMIKSVKSYGDVKIGELALLRGSQGYLEVAARERSASGLLKVRYPDELVISAG